MWFSKSIAFLVALTLAGLIPAHAGPISQLIVFGDSNVDIGNSFKASGGRVNGPPNYMGRASNGPLFVDYVSTRLGVPINDYAFGGATTGMDVPVPGEVIPSVLTQVKTFTASLGGGRADPNALYIYSAGGNDLAGATPASAHRYGADQYPGRAYLVGCSRSAYDPCHDGDAPARPDECGRLE